MSFVEHGHLGGYIPGGDDATYYPVLWEWLVSGEEQVKSILDVGCGEGIALEYFELVGAQGLGIEGVPQNNPHIIPHDYTEGPWSSRWYGHLWDLVWCCEFVEHVEEEFVPNFLETFKQSKTVLMTHAMPGQQGYHHVNLQTPRYWIEQMRSIDYSLDVDLTLTTRTLAGYNPSPWNHYVRSGLAFRRNDG